MKIKSSIAVVFLVLASRYCPGQASGEIIIAPGANTLILPTTSSFAESYGLDIGYFVTDWLSFQYRYSLIVNTERKLGFGAPMGFYGSIFSFSNILFQNGTETFWFMAGILSLLVPDGVAFHFPAKRKDMEHPVTYGPFVRILSTEYNLLNQKETKGYGFAGWQFGIPFRNNFVFTPYAGAGLLYGENYTGNWGITAGMSAGMIF